MQYWLAAWNDHGVEYLEDISIYENDEALDALAILAGRKPVGDRLSRKVEFLQMRARINNHRNYQVVAFSMGGEMTEDDLANKLESSAELRDLCVRRGLVLF